MKKRKHKVGQSWTTYRNHRKVRVKKVGKNRYKIRVVKRKR